MADWVALPWVGEQRLAAFVAMVEALDGVDSVKRSTLLKLMVRASGLLSKTASEVVRQSCTFGLVRHAETGCRSVALTELGRRWLASDEAAAVLRTP